jgi:cytochrome c553
MNHSMRSSLGLVCALAFATSVADEQDFAYCTTCHGSQGNGNLAIRAPKIAGMEAWYLQRQLEAFRDGLRGAQAEDIAGQEMQPVGKRLDRDTNIAAVVRYVQGFEPKPVPSTVTGNVQRGETLYRTCGACHGARGEGNERLGAPALAARAGKR